MNKNERMNALNANGFDTSKYFNVLISKDVPQGTTFTVTIGENGEPKVNMEAVQKILDNIEDEGYVKSSKLFRRWVMAQTFRMMKHKDGFNGALKEKPYNYQWTMLENELHAMSKLQKEDMLTFEKRRYFFTKEVIIAMLEDYKEKAKARWHDGNHDWNYYYDRVYYKALEIADAAIKELNSASNYSDYYRIVKEFNKDYNNCRPNVKLYIHTPKCKEWIDAYKGAGAYYSLQNYYMFHADRYVKIPAISDLTNGSYLVVTSQWALDVLENMKEIYKGNWWKLFGYFKEVIKLNDFSFDKAMYDKYHK